MLSHIKREDIYRLANLSIVPQQISIPIRKLGKLDKLPQYKLQVWLQNLLMDETYNISVFLSDIKYDQVLLKLKDTMFRYQLKQLFGRSKHTKLKVKIYRGNSKWNEVQFVEEFNLAISQFSYDYCKNLTNTYREHAVGKINGSYMVYKIYCQYQLMDNKQNNKPNQKIQGKKQDSHIRYSDKDTHVGPFSPLYNIDNTFQHGILPLNTYDQQFSFLDQQHSSDVFIETEKIRPIYNTDGQVQKDRVKLKLQRSIVAMDEGMNEPSTLSQQIKLNIGINKVLTVLFYIFMLWCSYCFVMLLQPNRKL